MEKKRKPTVLYSIWRNSDDRLLILDGSAEECCELLGVTKQYLYKMACVSGTGEKYTVRKILRKDATWEEET